MTATSHALIGTAIAATFHNPLLAIPIALASHVVADYIPHWDAGTNSHKKDKHQILIESMFDVILGLFLAFVVVVFLFPQTNLLYALLIIVVAQLPDWLMAPYYFFRIKQFK